MGDDIEKFKDDTGTEHIKLKVIGSDKNEIHFRVKMSTVMSKLKKSYSDRIGVSPETLRFLYDGVRLSDDATAKSLAMCNDDIIEVYQQQSGGRATSLYKMTNPCLTR